jgi:hypothetical protein
VRLEKQDPLDFQACQERRETRVQSVLKEAQGYKGREVKASHSVSFQMKTKLFIIHLEYLGILFNSGLFE